MQLTATTHFSLTSLCREGRLKEALHILLTVRNPPEDSSAYIQLLQTCILKNSLSQGKNVHSFIAHRKWLSGTRATHNKLIYMYAKCESLKDARKLFDQMNERDVVSWNTIIAAYSRHGCPDEAVTLFHQMQRTDFQPDQFTFASVLPACAELGALEQGIGIHQTIKNRGISSNVVVATALVDMYAKCGIIDKARELFNLMPHRNVVSWNVMVAGYAQIGFVEEALETFIQMQLAGVKPDFTTFASILPACAKIGALEQGMYIHQSIKDTELLSNVVVASALVDMYAKCGRVDKARELFDRMTRRDVISWNAMIVGYAQNGYVEKALDTFKQMQLAGINPNFVTFASILPACAKIGALEQGMDIHRSIIQGGFPSDTIVGNALLDMYAKCKSIDKARDVFERMPQRNVVSWTAMIAGYAQNGFVERAVETFKEMQLSGVKANSTTFVSILSACAKMRSLEQGMNIHQSIIEGGFLSDIMIENALVDMYAKGERIDKAHELFYRMPQRNVVSWTAMIAGYAQNGFLEKALETFKQMQLADVKPNSTTLASILPACAKMGLLEQGVDIHQSIEDKEILSDVIVATALLDMYAKCGSIEKAHELFEKMHQRHVVSWNAMIAGYVQNGFFQKALETFKQMQMAGVKLNSTTFASILSTCAQMGALEQGIDIHRSIMEWGYLLDIIVANALIDMYAKCGSIDKACNLFDKMFERDVISWNAMIAGYTQNGFVEKALESFKQMQWAGVKPNSITFPSILPACAKMGALEQGTDIHQSIMEGGFLSDIIIANALIDMYAKCASIDKARALFDRLPERDVISWNAMISGYAQNGYCEEAFNVFELMKHSGTSPDTVSFACVLYACSHAGLVNEGSTYFNHMSNLYCITPTIDHYVCIVDLLARAGYLEDTLNFIIKIPVKPVVVVWMSFLGGCRSHMNIGLGVFSATLLLDLDSKNAATYVLLSNIYAEVGRWDEVQMVRKLMKDRGIRKIPGCSWIEVHKMVHAFCVRQRLH